MKDNLYPALKTYFSNEIYECSNKKETNIFYELSKKFRINGFFEDFIRSKYQPDTLLLDKKQLHLNFIKQTKYVCEIAKKFNESAIKYRFLKGTALRMLVYKYPFQRICRDIDVYVDVKDLTKAYKTLREIGYKYIDPNCRDSCEGTRNYSRHLPKMSNEDGAIVELHHKIIWTREEKKCFLSELASNNYITSYAGDIPINFLQLEHCLLHIIHHAKFQKTFENGPQAYIDIFNILSNCNIDLDKVRSIAKQINVSTELEYILKNINMMSNGKIVQDDIFCLMNNKKYYSNTNTQIKLAYERLKWLPYRTSYESQIPLMSIKIIPEYIKRLLNLFSKAFQK